MAAVRMLVKLSGSRDGAEWPDAGAVLVCPDDEAAGLIGSGLAAEVAADTTAERAVAPEAAEAAVVKRSPRKS